MLLLYVPCASKKEAEKIGQTLVREKLVACANVLPRMTSFYWWKDKLQKDQEALLLCKTLEKNKRKAEKRVRELHSYKIPCIAFYKTERVNEDYLRWAEIL